MSINKIQQNNTKSYFLQPYSTRCQGKYTQYQKIPNNCDKKIDIVFGLIQFQAKFRRRPTEGTTVRPARNHQYGNWNWRKNKFWGSIFVIC